MNLKTINLIWPYLVLFLSPISFCLNIYEWRKNPNWNQLKLLLTFNLFALNLHQIEKYIYPGKFRKRFNNFMFQDQQKKQLPLSHELIFFSEMLYLLIGILSIIFSNDFPFLGLFLIGFSTFTLFLSGFKLVGKPESRDFVGSITGFFIYLPLNIFSLVFCFQNLGYLRSSLSFFLGVIVSGLFLWKIIRIYKMEMNYKAKKTQPKSY